MDDFGTLVYFTLHSLLHEILTKEIYLSTPYISSKVDAISHVLIPLAYKANIWSANILALRYPFFTIIGSKLELWSREVLTLFYLLLFESFYYTISITAVIC